jgi:hypothetical protein
MLTQAKVRELFDYDPDTGNLTWRITKSATAVVGSIAGSVNEKGHINLQIDKTMYSAHQVVFLWHYGYIPPEIDHINRIKTDNRIGNLRPCTSTAAQNKGNIGLLRTNTSGYKGVSLNKRSGKYHAQIKINGKQTYLGRFDTPEEAALCYNKAAWEYFGEFAYLNEVLPEWLR